MPISLVNRLFRTVILLITLLFLSVSFGQENQALSTEDKAVLTQLADLLEKPALRDAVIKELRNLATDQNDEQSVEQDEENATPIIVHDKDVESDIANVTQKLADQSSQVASELNEKFQYTGSVLFSMLKGDFSQLGTIDFDAILKTMKNVLILIVVAVLVYQISRYTSRPLKKRLNKWSLEGSYRIHIARRLVATFLVFILDLVFIGITYLLVRAIATFVLGETGEISEQAKLFIFAFVSIEIVKAFVRLLFYPRYIGLRLLSGDNKVIKYWYRWMCNIINLLGYGFLFIIPVVQTYIKNEVIAQLLTILFAVVAFIYGVTTVIRHRKEVRQAIRNVAAKSTTAVANSFLNFVALTWHYFAVLYFLMLMIVTILWTEEALPFVLKGTANTILVVGAGFLLSALITAIIERGIKLPLAWKKSIPGLEKRLNTYIPLILRVIRFVLIVAVILLLMSVWNLIDFPSWLESDTGKKFVNKWNGVLWIVLVSMFIWIVVSAIIENKLTPKEGKEAPSARAQTLLSLAKNALAIIITATCIMMSLSQIGINIGPLIAGAGVLGLAVGFGAQTLVKDVITGIFIQLENAINTGDWITVGGISGTAERISIRSVSLRDTDGTFHIVPFSSVTTVSNYMREFAFHKGEYQIAYNEDIDFACKKLQEAFAELKNDPNVAPHILADMTIPGVIDLGASAVVIRILIKTTPGYQWVVGRAFNRLVKIYFDQAGIEIPYPHQTIYFGQNKDSSTPPLNVRTMNQPFDLNGKPEK